MLLLTATLRDRIRLFREKACPIPYGAPRPTQNEIVLIARWRRRNGRRVHEVYRAMRTASARVGRDWKWLGISGWIMGGSCWILNQPFLLEGVQLTPTDYSTRAGLLQVHPTDAAQVLRRNLLASTDGLPFGPRIPGYDDYDLIEAFHRLWGRSVGTPGYVKADWQKLGQMLEERGVLK